MRVKNSITWRRSWRDATQAADVLQADAPASRSRAMVKAASLMAIAAAITWGTTWPLASSDVMTGVGLSRSYPTNSATPTRDASRNCSARYAALLDLAELARRDGKSSEVVIRGLSDRRGAMSGCLPINRAEPANP